MVEVRNRFKQIRQQLPCLLRLSERIMPNTCRLLKNHTKQHRDYNVTWPTIRARKNQAREG